MNNMIGTLTYGQVIALIPAIAGFMGALYAIITHRTKLKLWFRKRRERQDTLDELVRCAESIKCSNETIEEVSMQVKDMNERMLDLSSLISALAATQERTIQHNLRQDLEIKKSLEQRELITDSLFALMDGFRQLEVNGVVTDMWIELRKETSRFAHQSLDIDKTD